LELTVYGYMPIYAIGNTSIPHVQRDNQLV